VWIEYFKGTKTFLFINELILNNNICINDLILTEILPSIIHKKEFALVDLLKSIKKYEINISWEELQHFQSLNIKNGLHIVQNCIQNNCKLLSCDKQFITMSKYLDLKPYSHIT
jgi:hypothetical protein